jgi:outer membrane protein
MVFKQARAAVLAGLFGLCCSMGGALAQQPPAAAPPAITIMVVDVQTLLQTSKAGKSVIDQLKAKAQEYQKQLDNEKNSIVHEYNEFNDQVEAKTITREVAIKKQKELQDKDEALREHRLAIDNAFSDARGKALAQIQDVMVKIITDIAKERKANLVFQRSDLVLFDHAFDVTDEVLGKLDEQLPTLNVNFTAPVAANAPAPAPPAATPAPPKPPAPPKKK